MAAAAPETPAIVTLDLDIEEVVESVRSLYTDELKPFGRILRKRVAERASAVACNARDKGELPCDEKQAMLLNGALPNVDMKELRVLCAGCDRLRLDTEEGGDWSVLLVGAKDNFVDVYAPKDIYPEELWQQVAEYISNLAGTPSQNLPGGRYSCAQALMTRQLPFLEGLSLGRVCHIVQLAISQKKILGYLNGTVVPYESSQSMMKEQRAEQQLPYSKPTNDVQEFPYATLDVACSCLQMILATETAGGAQAVPLSNIKRLFRSRFRLDLSETMLGHSKLSELLQDERFSHVCSVKLASHGYVVAPKVANKAPKVPPGLWGSKNVNAVPFSPQHAASLPPLAKKVAAPTVVHDPPCSALSLGLGHTISAPPGLESPRPQRAAKSSAQYPDRLREAVAVAAAAEAAAAKALADLANLEWESQWGSTAPQRTYELAPAVSMGAMGAGKAASGSLPTLLQSFGTERWPQTDSSKLGKNKFSTRASGFQQLDARTEAAWEQKQQEQLQQQQYLQQMHLARLRREQQMLPQVADRSVLLPR